MPRPVLNPLTGQFDMVSSNADFDSRYVLKSGDTMIGQLNVQMDYATFKSINTNSSQFAGAKFLAVNNFSSMGNQGGGWLLAGINDASHTQGYLALEQTDYQGNYVGTLMKFDYNAGDSTVYQQLNTRKLRPSSSWTYDIGDSGSYYASCNVGSGFYLQSINGHVERNTDTRMDLGFYSNEGTGFEIYRYNDSTRPGQFRTVYGGAAGQGELDFIHYDGTNFPTYLKLDGSGTLRVIASDRATGTKLAAVGGVIFDHYADVGNTHTDGSTFDDLYSDTTAANTLFVNGDKVIAEYGGQFVAHATATRQIKVLFAGTTVLSTGTITTATLEYWNVNVTIIRETSAVVRVIAKIVASTTTGTGVFDDVTYTRVTGLTLSNTNILKIQGVSGGTGAAANDVIAQIGYVEYKPAGS